MGRIKIYPPVKYFTAVTISDIHLWTTIKSRLETIFSGKDEELDWYDFTHTEYYQHQMGSGLKKKMVCYKNLMPAENLPDFKLATNTIEEEYTRNGKRTVNIDPGYVCNAKLILATTKDYSHRIYLSRGIFGDVHLQIRNHQFQPNAWTYPDYKEEFVLQFFNKVYDIYLNQMAKHIL